MAVSKIKTLLLFCLFFLVIFIKIPLSGSLAGKIDCLWHVAEFSDIENRVHALVHGSSVTTSFYPYSSPWMFGEPGFGVAAIYILVHAVVPDFIWSYYMVCVVLFSFTAFAFYILAGEYVASYLARFAGGIFFTMANFSLGQIDHHNVFFWGIALISIFFLHRFIATKRAILLWCSFLLLGIQIYFSSTIFIYLGIWLAVLVVVHYNIWSQDLRWLHLIGAVALCIGLISPFVVFFATNADIQTAYNPSLSAGGFHKSNLWLIDYFRFLPDNLIHRRLHDIDFDLMYRIKCASPGIVLFTLSLLGFKHLPKREILPVMLVGFILALGGVLKVGDFSIPMPMDLYYLNFPKAPILLTPIRAYFIVHWVLCMAAVFGLSRMIVFFPKVKILGLAVVILFLIENVPAPLPSMKVEKAIEEGKELSTFLSKGKGGTVLHLPSQVFASIPLESNALQMNSISREFYYILLQTMYKKNTMNGVDCLVPKRRIGFNNTFQLGSRDSFENLLRAYDVRYIVFHDDLALADEHRLADSLSLYPFLRSQGKVGNAAVFTLK